MTKSPEQIVDELARQCAKQLEHDFMSSAPTMPITDRIKQSLPLVELLELTATVIKAGHLAHVPHCDICVKLTNLTTKLKQLGIEI